MAYSRYSTYGGHPAGMFQNEKHGWKNIPFVRSECRPMNYRFWQMDWVEGNSHTQNANYRTGYLLWGERIPEHADRGGPYSNVDFNREGNLAYARAYSKFKDKVYTQATNLTALKERAKTIDMVLARLLQLHKGAKALKKGRFSEFLSVFGLKKLPKHKNKLWSRPKEFGALWLEYWMGWAPTVGDVYSTLDFLGKEIPDHPVRAGSTVPYSGYYQQWNSPAHAVSEWEGKVTVGLKAVVVMTNPTLYNLQGLGLANPLKTLWETTPFSWFADWFTNVGQILGQLTDWVGLQLKDLEVSCKTKAWCSWVCDGAHAIYGGQPRTLFRERLFSGFSRKVGGTLPIVKPILRLPNGLSITRGATLASLLVTIFAPERARKH